MPEARTTAKKKGARPGSRPRAAASPAKAGTKAGTITIVQVRSGIGCNKTHKRVLRSLGLRHPRQKVVRPDNPAVRGMVETIPHLVRIVEGAND